MRTVLARTALVAVLSMATSIGAAPARRAPSNRTLTAPNVIPSLFKLLGAAADITPFEFTMHLTPADLPGLASWLESNSQTPGNPLSQEELAKYASPSADALTAVDEFLKAQGFTDGDITYNTLKDQATVRSTVGQAAKVFAAQFDSYKIANQTLARTKKYTIPSAVADFVELVQPLASFADLPGTGPIQASADTAAKATGKDVPSSCDTSGVTPACLRDLYGTASYNPTNVKGKTDVFIAGFIGQSFSQSSLTTFLKKYRPDAASAQVDVIDRAGALNIPLLPGDEAMLDVETIVSATYPLTSTFFNYGNQFTQGDLFQAALADILENYDKYGQPGVYSISYGSDENSMTQAEADLLCSTAMKLTARGTTIVLASGDNGVGGTSGDDCPPFVPTYPSGCQYITSVGATQSFDPEVAVDPSLGGFYSGSGFSNLYSQPSFQEKAVSAYISALDGQDDGQYNKSGRAYPDVSAQGSRYIIQTLSEGKVSGTSASAPTFASIIALLNDARRKSGKGNIGWFNPKAYANNQGFTDVAKGNSSGCANTKLDFPTAQGWDPSTGLGTPIFSQLQAIYG